MTTDAQDRSIFDEEVQWMREHAAMLDGDTMVEYNDGLTEYVPVARRRYGSDESNRGRVAAADAHFTLTLATDLRARQSAERAAARKATVARHRAQRSGRAAKYSPESDAALVSALLRMPLTD